MASIPGISWSDPSPPSQSTVKEDDCRDKLKERRQQRLRVGIALFEPWAICPQSRQKNEAPAGEDSNRRCAGDDNKRLVGFEVELARRLACDYNNIPPEFVIKEWGELIPALYGRPKGQESCGEKEIDVIISGMAITGKRAAEMNFSDAYAEQRVALLVKLDSAGGRTLADLNNKLLTVAVINESVSENYARKVAFTKAQLDDSAKDVDDVVELFKQDAKNAPPADGSTKRSPDMFLGTAPLPFAVADKLRGIVDVQVLREPLARYYTGFATSKGDANHDFLNYLNSWILARRGDNWIEQRRAYWFDSIDWLYHLDSSDSISNCEAVEKQYLKPSAGR